MSKKLLSFYFPRVFLGILAISMTLSFFNFTLFLFVSRQPSSLFRFVGGRLAYDLTPGFEGGFSEVPVRINQQGLRENGDVSLSKREEVDKRIIGMGDSLGFGFGLREEATYLRQLEEILNEQSEQKFEVINGSVTGYNTFQERVFLEKNLLKYQPDVVLLSFVLNDISGDFHVPNNIHRTLAPFKAGAYSPLELSEREQLFYALFGRLPLYRFLHPYLKSFWGFEDPKDVEIEGHYAKKTLYFYRNGDYQDSRYEGGIEKVEKELLKINELAKANNFQLVIVIFPVEIQLGDKALRKPQELLGLFCEENQLKCLDLLPVLGGETENVFLDLGHPNSYGSQVAAKAVSEYLIKTIL